jgi:hypothetical protein
VVNERLRIGDAERDEAARELGEHFALGRITADEHSERLEQIWSARTAGDLAPAFRDLPRPKAGRPDPVRPRGPRPSRGWRPELPHVPFPLKVLIGIVAVWWGCHHLLFLLIGLFVYVVVVRRLVRRRTWHQRLRDHVHDQLDEHLGSDWQGRSGSWDRGRYQTGWR